jgi:hypothetical protein
VAVDGDGAALMRMGVFATLGAYGPANLTHVLLDNNAHDSTGGQATVSHNVSFAGVAAACGYASAIEGDNLDMLDACWPRGHGHVGPEFRLPADRAGTPDGLPRPSVTPAVKTRLAARSAPTRPNAGGSMLLLNPGPVTLSERVRRACCNRPVPSRKRVLRPAGRSARGCSTSTGSIPPNGRPC